MLAVVVFLALLDCVIFIFSHIFFSAILQASTVIGRGFESELLAEFVNSETHLHDEVHDACC